VVLFGDYANLTIGLPLVSVSGSQSNEDPFTSLNYCFDAESGGEMRE